MESFEGEISEGQVVVRKANNKVIVELQSFSSKDDINDDYYLMQSVLEITEKVGRFKLRHQRKLKLESRILLHYRP